MGRFKSAGRTKLAGRTGVTAAVTTGSTALGAPVEVTAAIGLIPLASCYPRWTWRWFRDRLLGGGYCRT